MFLVCYAQVYGAFGRPALLQKLRDDLASSSDLRLRGALLALTLATGQLQLPGNSVVTTRWRASLGAASGATSGRCMRPHRPHMVGSGQGLF